ncbi:MAG: hypothetical protein UT86_C0003G0105 [Candidatus Magasanikbacteria bacterium GW2011_GWC2_40_17]|uniref:Uncharacterized protein n=1 Tax=Candidatus Magasanikbacteria bacterium GW2011_GWA2_42_32 TaxID=1619039 RepID=A0A0G1D4P8_9BACT|nr:MAG: hypothetical protein UT86_C0003G0105 [Candidatus Magasanikbacteria bacterium GW2011_GWC2_40_17]KKS57008.1 MAG: hypothetical protein UV20_C0004G0104 [Candidatus Magasanikbacteria bacterium GW2011_GWA2_42_32]OGH85735.1 MAG: hypothetical protein A2294_03860 [Candidatus Magasanikbacteria bacterium RIFOXYB2_FULL_38_10]
MKKIFIIFGIILAFSVAHPLLASAQMMGNSVQNPEILQEEAKGKEIFDKLQSKTTACNNLSDDEFEVLGDYFMGQMMGSSHSTMDALMEQRIGKDNNRLMHIALGKRLSGCDTSASFPSQGYSFLPMMGMMNGGYSNILSQPGVYNYGIGMMGASWNGWSMMGGQNVTGIILYILVLVFFVGGIAVFVKYLLKK